MCAYHGFLGMNVCSWSLLHHFAFHHTHFLCVVAFSLNSGSSSAQTCTSSPRCRSCGRWLPSRWWVACLFTSSSTYADASRRPATPSLRRKSWEEPRLWSHQRQRSTLSRYPPALNSDNGSCEMDFYARNGKSNITLCAMCLKTNWFLWAENNWWPTPDSSILTGSSFSSAKNQSAKSALGLFYPVSVCHKEGKGVWRVCSGSI